MNIREKKLYKNISVDTKFLNKLLGLNSDKLTSDFSSLRFLFYVILTYSISFVVFCLSSQVRKFYQENQADVHWYIQLVGTITLTVPTLIAKREKLTEVENLLKMRIGEFMVFLKNRLKTSLELSSMSPQVYRYNYLLAGNVLVFSFSYLWVRMQAWFDGVHDHINYISIPFEFLEVINTRLPDVIEIIFVGYIIYIISLAAPKLEKEISETKEKRYRRLHLISLIFNCIQLLVVVLVITWYLGFLSENQEVTFDFFGILTLYVLVFLYVQPVLAIFLHTKHTLNLINNRQSLSVVCLEYLLLVPLFVFVVFPAIVIPTLLFLLILTAVVAIVKVIDRLYGLQSLIRVAGFVMLVLLLLMNKPG